MKFRRQKKSDMQYILFLHFFVILVCNGEIPLVVNTWQSKFAEATKNAWQQLQQNGDSLDALVEGCRTCQTIQCDFTVGYGGSPDENGETTLDALIFDGDTINMGAVGALRNIKDAIGVARYVLDNTQHSFLAGELAQQFATNLGFTSESLETNYSLGLYETWKKQDNCQPNFWTNVSPDPTKNCGPYTPKKSICRKLHSTLTNEILADGSFFNTGNHDTIGMIVINERGHIVAGTTTNGANHKIPGRVGDSPIPGAGGYADSEVGAAVCTGDGDIMMRFLPSFLAVEQLRQGATPTKAAKIAIERIATKYPSFFGGIVVADKKGVIGAACNGMVKFPFSVMNGSTTEPILDYVACND